MSGWVPGANAEPRRMLAGSLDASLPTLSHARGAVSETVSRAARRLVVIDDCRLSRFESSRLASSSRGLNR